MVCVRIRTRIHKALNIKLVKPTGYAPVCVWHIPQQRFRVSPVGFAGSTGNSPIVFDGNM